MLPILYKKQFISALSKYQGIEHFKDDMFVFKKKYGEKVYFWIVDNGGEILVDMVNSAHLPINIPDSLFGSLVTPFALGAHVREVCIAFSEQYVGDTKELADTWDDNIVKWQEWIRKYDQWWDSQTDGKNE